jgi:GNAT superfamily N-acetyltransferase
MPAMLDDPDSPTIYRTSGQAPFPDPHDAHPTLPVDVYPRQVTLRDRVTIATIVPFSSRHQVPPSLLAYLSDQLNKEIEMGDTYPMIDTMSVEKFGSYWFQNFGAVMLLGNLESADEIIEGKNWATECLGSFYIKPNYPGRSSHVCNAGFLVTDAARNRGVGRLMGESYLEWAPRIGYTYSVFNLVYETNVASCRIWDALGFKRIGRVKGAGNLKSYPGQLIDAIVYGRDLGPEGEDFVSEERFDKIKFYLKYGKYPAGADRAEKSRLRSAATHYKLLDNDKLMLKDKEVISDPQRQYEIARNIHVLQHGGINKTTATIAEKYHWVRIKETVSLVIRNCAECKELGKAPIVRADGVIRPRPTSQPPMSSSSGQGGVSAAGRVLSLPQMHDPTQDGTGFPEQNHIHHGSVSPQVLNRTLPQSSQTPSSSHLQSQLQQQRGGPAPVAPMAGTHTLAHQQNIRDDYMPLDPQIMEDVRTHLGSYNSSSHTHAHAHTHDPSLSQQESPSPQFKFSSHHNPLDHDHEHDEHSSHHDHDADSFQAMLSAGREDSHHDVGHHGTVDGSAEPSNDNEDLDMLIDQDDADADADGEGEVDVDVDGVQEVGIHIQVEAVARAAEEALRTVGREYGSG